MGFGEGLTGYAAQYAAALMSAAKSGVSDFAAADTMAHSAASAAMGGSGLTYQQVVAAAAGSREAQPSWTVSAATGYVMPNAIGVPLSPAPMQPAVNAPVVTEASRIDTGGRIVSEAVRPDAPSSVVPKGPDGVTLPVLSREAGNIVAMAVLGLLVAKVLR